MSSETNYSASSKSRPEKNISGGYGNYCCIPGCTSALYDKSGKKTEIGFFRIPKNEPLRKKWVQAIKNVRRKGGTDNFNVNDPKKNYRVCEFHFKPEDLRLTWGSGKKKVIDGRLPSIFKSEEKRTKHMRPPPRERQPLISSSEESEEILSEEESIIEYADVEPNVEVLSETDILRTEIQELKQKIQELEQHNISLAEENKCLKSHTYSYKNVHKNAELFRSATGLEEDSFDILYDFLNPGEDCCNIKFYDSSKRLSGETKEDKMPKSGPKPKLPPCEQFFMYLTWLKNGFTLSHCAWLFNISKATVSRYIITWTNFCYFSLGAIPIWPTRQQVDDVMPESFKRTYSTTRCIIDCTELFCQRPSSLAIQSSLYSHYKSHATYKGLLGISPSGAITFISQLFDGSISDKEIVRKSGILEKELRNVGDSIMADRGFTIEDDLKPLSVHLNIPSFLGGRDQLSAAEVKESQTIASVRIHVERAIQRVKKFRIIRNEIPLTLHGSVNQIWTVCCLLCNFLPPLIQKEYEL